MQVYWNQEQWFCCSDGTFPEAVLQSEGQACRGTPCCSCLAAPRGHHCPCYHSLATPSCIRRGSLLVNNIEQRRIIAHHCGGTVRRQEEEAKVGRHEGPTLGDPDDKPKRHGFLAPPGLCHCHHKGQPVYMAHHAECRCRGLHWGCRVMLFHKN